MSTGRHYLTGNARVWIVGQTIIQYTVCNSITQFIRMPFRNGLSRIKSLHFFLLIVLYLRAFVRAVWASRFRRNDPDEQQGYSS